MLVQQWVDKLILRLPTWLRWLLVIPVAFAADLAVQSVYQIIFRAIPFAAVRPYADELIWRFFAPLLFVVAGVKMAPRYWFMATCCLTGFKVVVAVVNIHTLSLYVLRGGSLKAPVYITAVPVWWSLLVHLLFLAFAVFVVAKDQNIRKVPSENAPILDF
jgi:hypothetical protein